MITCPICRADWPQPLTLSDAVCSHCFAVFERRPEVDQQPANWRQVPPGWSASSAIPFPLGTIARLRSVDYRIVGFARYSYQEEYGRDQWETFERHEYTLNDLTGANPRLLCWTSYGWFFAKPVDPTAVTSSTWTEIRHDGRIYLRQQPQPFTSQDASGYLTHPFRWREMVSISDFFSERFVIASEHPGRSHFWAGEQLDGREVTTAFALPELPAIYRTSAPRPTPVAPSKPHASAAAIPKSASPWRSIGAMIVALAVLLAVGTLVYRYERQAKPVAAHWFAAGLQPATQSFDVPPGAGRLEFDPHFPMGALRYRVRVLDRQGRELETRQDFLDMNPNRRTLIMTLAGRAASVEVTSTLSIRIHGMENWPVEVRFLR